MKPSWILFDWGNTLMVDFEEYSGPMVLWPRVEAITHARETLGLVRSQGWRIALATNAGSSDEPMIRAALVRVGLNELVERIYCSRGVGHNTRWFHLVQSDWNGFAESHA